VLAGGVVTPPAAPLLKVALGLSRFDVLVLATSSKDGKERRRYREMLKSMKA
jgi:hypothetical protein